MRLGQLQRPYAWLAATGAVLRATTASAQDSLGGPAGAGVLVSAVDWLENTLLGTLATLIATIAIAAIGFLLLTGRVEWRRGVTAIIGCFILFGAPAIAAGLLSALNGIEEPSVPSAEIVAPPPAVPPPPPIIAPTPPTAHEPVL